MSDCCSPSETGAERPASERCAVPAERERATCPSCGQRGKAVDTQTVKGLLRVSLRTIQEGTQYYFCRTADCAVVYFNEDGRQTYTREAIRVAVYQKAPDEAATPLCYCFGYTVGDVRDAVHNRTEEALLEDITIGTQLGQCACDIRNPQGSCCLGNVRRAVQSAAEAERR